jgi:hypothetical protein
MHLKSGRQEVPLLEQYVAPLPASHPSTHPFSFPPPLVLARCCITSLNRYLSKISMPSACSPSLSSQSQTTQRFNAKDDSSVSTCNSNWTHTAFSHECCTPRRKKHHVGYIGGMVRVSTICVEGSALRHLERDYSSTLHSMQYRLATISLPLLVSGFATPVENMEFFLVRCVSVPTLGFSSRGGEDDGDSHCV